MCKMHARTVCSFVRNMHLKNLLHPVIVSKKCCAAVPLYKLHVYHWQYLYCEGKNKIMMTNHVVCHFYLLFYLTKQLSIEFILLYITLL